MSNSNWLTTNGAFSKLLDLVVEPSTTLDSDLFHKRLQDRQEIFSRYDKLVAVLGEMPDLTRDGLAKLKAVSERWTSAFGKKNSECSPKRVDDLKRALKELADQPGNYGEKHAGDLAERPLPWFAKILLDKSVDKKDLFPAAAAQALVAELDLVSSLCLGGGALDRVLSLWLARPFLVFRTVGGSNGAVDLPLLYAALGLLAEKDSVVRKKAAIAEVGELQVPGETALDALAAGVAWKGGILRGATGSVRRATFEDVQLSPQAERSQTTDGQTFVDLQAFVDLQSSWVHGFLSQVVFKANDDEVLAGALTRLLEVVLEDGRLGFVRIDLGKLVGKPDSILRTGFEVIVSAPQQSGPRERLGFPLHVFSDSAGVVSFPAVFASAADGVKKIPGLPVFALGSRPEQGASIPTPALVIHLRDARTTDGNEVPVSHNGKVDLSETGAYELSVTIDADSLASITKKVNSQFEDAVKGIEGAGTPEAPYLLPAEASEATKRALRAIEWPRAKVKLEPGAEGSMGQLLASAVQESPSLPKRVDQYLPAYLYAADSAKALEGESFRDMDQTVPSAGPDGQARQAWRALQEVQPTRFRDELAKQGVEGGPLLPMRTGHWLRLRRELADLPVKVSVNGQTSVKTASQLAGSVLAAARPKAIANAFEAEQLRILGAVAYAFGDTRSVDAARGAVGGDTMADVLTRFGEAWVALDGVDQGYSSNPATNEDLVARLWQALKAAGVEGPASLARLCRSDVLRLAKPRLPADFPLAVIGQQHTRARVAGVRSGNVKVEVANHALSSSVTALSGKPATGAAGGDRDKPLDASQPDLPDLRRLFGSLDVCACEEDESVYGAPAYLVDAMEFLRYKLTPTATCLNNFAFKGSIAATKAATPPPGSGSSAACCYPQPSNALEVLLERRPDLEHLDLNAANTTIQLPHIDLVNEILEAALAGDPETLGDMVRVDWARDLDPEAPVPPALIEDLRAEGIDVTAAAQLSAVDLPNAETRDFPCRQVVLLRDAHASVRFQRERPGGRWAISRNRNTTLPAASLAAEPEYVNESVYRSLERKASGLSLPFGLSEARLDSYLNLVDADRAKIDTAWQGEDDSDELTRIRRAGLALGLQLCQTQLIAQIGQSIDESELWRRISPRNYALHQASALELLQGLELEEAELRAWLRSVSMRSIGLDSNWPTDRKQCDTAKVLIRWSSHCEPFLLTRAIRLRRALEWTVAEIDQAICSPRIGAGSLDLKCLEQIGALKRVSERLKASRESVIAMFGRIASEGYENEELSLYWRIFLDAAATDDPAVSADSAQFQPDQIVKLRFADMVEALALRLGIDAQLLKALFSERAAHRDKNQEANLLVHQELLSELWGHVQLKGLLSLAWGEYFAALRMFRLDGELASPFESPRALNAFLDELDAAKLTSSLNLGNTCLLLTGRRPAVPGEAESDRLEPRDDAIRGVILGIARELSARPEEIRRGELARKAWLRRDKPGLDPAEASAWWSAFGEKASADLAQACWEPILAAASEVEAVRLQTVAWAGETDPIRLQLPSAAQLKPEGEAFGAFRELVGGTASHPAPDTDRLAEVLGQVLRPLLNWTQFGATADERLSLIKSCGVERVRLIALIGKHIGGIEKQDEITPGQLAELDELRGQLETQEQALLQLMTSPFVGRAYAAETTRTLLSGVRTLAPLHEAALVRFLQSIKVDGGLSADDWLVSLDWTEIHEQFERPAMAIAIGSSRVSLVNTVAVKALWILLKRLARGALLLHSLGLTERSLVWVLGSYARVLGLLAPWQLPSWRWAKADVDPSTRLPTLELEPLEADGEVLTAWHRLRSFAHHSKLLPDIEDSANPARSITLGSMLSAVIDASRLVNRRKAPKPDEWRDATDGLAIATAAWDLLSGNVPGTGWAVLFDGKAHSQGCSVDEALLQRAFNRLKSLENLKLLSERAAWSVQSGLDQGVVARLTAVGRGSEDVGPLAKEVRSLLKRRFAESDWLNAIKNSSDQVRQRKRNALLDCLLGIPIPRYFDANGIAKCFESKNDVLKHFLIDPEVSPCKPTTRIVAAHDAVQMFVQRCRAGLESKMQIPDDQLVAWSAWDWMKEYRIWQAARKIFLYPENWIDHELRDDRSVFFKDLQDELSQGKLSERSVENAVITYLQQLNVVARLETCSAYYEFNAEKRVVHLIGRTRSDPRKYFYRQWIDEAEWTPWEPIDLEINSEQICLFARNGRIYLAWLMATIAEDKVVGDILLPTSPGKTVPTTAHWELKLALSEYANARWSAKRVGTGALPFFDKTPRPVNELKPELLKGVCLVFQDVASPSIAVYDRSTGSDNDRNGYIGRFSLATCSAEIGVVPPEGAIAKSFRPLPVVERAEFRSMRFIEHDSKQSDGTRGPVDTLLIKEGGGPEGTVEVLALTPGRFAVTVPQQSSLLDFLLGAVKIALADGSGEPVSPTAGAWLPIFYDAQGAYRPFVERDAANKDPVGDLMRLLGSAKALSSRPMVREASRNAADKVSRLIAGQLDQSVVQAALGTLSLEVAADPARAPDPRVWKTKIAGALGKNSKLVKYNGRLFHPASCDLLQVATTAGVKYLYYRDIQEERLPPTIAEQEAQDEETHRIAYRFEDSYASYNWELFVHIPLLIAKRYAAEGSYADSMRWFQAIFNVTGSEEKAGTSETQNNSGVSNYWIPRHFSETSSEQYEAQRISNLLDPRRWSVAESGLTEKELHTLLHNLFRSVKKWRIDPANPHQVSRHRWVAYQKAVVYQFIEMLLDWGDHQFRRDSRESVNQATTLYVLAQELLGARPVTLKPLGERQSKNYEQIRAEIDDADDLLATYANETVSADELPDDASANDGSGAFAIYNQYFCIPQNENLISLWDRVEDRLWKIRHCRNIDGIERMLALFAPPIDPGALVRARGAGGDLDALLAGLGQPLPHYRFTVMLQKAKSYAEEVRSLGNQLQQVLERRDAEALSLIRSRQEVKLLRSMSEVRRLQTQEAQQQIDALSALTDTVTAREKYYRSQPETSGKEEQALALAQAAKIATLASGLAKALSSGSALIPDVGAGYDVGPMAYILYGGRQIASASFNFGDFMLAVAGALQADSSIVGTRAGYERRKSDWTFQADQGVLELKQLEQQLKAAKTRWQITVAEGRQLEQQISNAEEADEFIKSKFTNRQLFDWMLKRSTGVYARAYYLALEFARMAERCLEAELPPGEASTSLGIIQSTYWDSGAKGLLAAEMLLGDLNRLDSEWTRRNRRELELTKQISLARLSPLELLKLRVTGKCRFTVPESLFNVDFPGHARRRIKAVSLSIPCVSGPFTNISCQLTLERSRIKLSEERVVLDPIPVRSICTSHAREDGGVFEFNLRDERYLPFEGAGAHSEWSLEFPGGMQFDWTTISDAVLTIRYTAQQVGGTLGIQQSQEDRWSEPFVFSLRDNFPVEFQALANASEGDPPTVTIALTRMSLPVAVGVGAWQLCAVIENEGSPVFEVENDELGGRATYQDLKKRSLAKLFVWTVASEKMKEIALKGIKIKRKDSKARLKDIVLIRAE